MESFKAYYKIRFRKDYVRQREEIAKKLEVDGFVNTVDFLKALAGENLLDTEHNIRLKFDTSKIIDVDPKNFAIYEYPSISYTLESERFEVLNFGNHVTILREDNSIFFLDYFYHMHKVVDSE
ncbi:hypothetical protein ACFPVY_03955 [Flavobacterium qiangtangense]|uniref:Uncharacterized protein n=1 Tax=Flavobacterium qiangtangense TaxID=1442595 RepID=A0ABW1PK45_9FLAO